MKRWLAKVPLTAAELGRITTQALSLVTRRHGVALDAPDDLVPIEFPERGAQVDRDLLRVVGSLYLAACFEAAGVIPAAEDLTRLARSGAIHTDLGAAAEAVQSFWRARDERASETERRALYADLFGMPGEVESSGRPPNVDFEERLLDLCEAIYRHAEGAAGGVVEIPRVRRAVQSLTENLQRATSAMTVMMAKDILKTQQSALQLLNQEPIRRALHANDIWEVMDAIDRLLRRSNPNRQPHIDRGRAGLTLLLWVGDATKQAGGSSGIHLDETLVGAAVDWLEASLALGEAAKSDAHPRRKDDPRSSWADVAR